MKATLSLFLLLSLLGVGVVRSEVVGSVDIGGDTVWVWRDFGDISVSGDAVTVRGNSRGYFVNNDVADGILDPDDFYQVCLTCGS